MTTGKSAMGRRRFIKITSTTLVLAGLPLAARMAACADVQPSANFGGSTPNASFYITS